MKRPVKAATRGQPIYERLPDDEWHDDIRITTVPRFKTSGLSGDEWRVSAHLQVFRKGVLVYERTYHRIADAAAHLPWLLMVYTEEGLPPTLTQGLCMQPGCKNLATVVYRKTTDGCGRCGTSKPRTEDRNEMRREFCRDHARRGDSNLDDMDERYQLLPSAAAGGAK